MCEIWKKAWKRGHSKLQQSETDSHAQVQDKGGGK